MIPSLIRQVELVSTAGVPLLTLSGANNVSYKVLAPVIVHQVGFIVTTALTTTAAVVEFSILQANGTDTTPTGVRALGACTATSATMAVNTGVWLDVAAVKGRRVVYPGEMINALVFTTAAAGVVQCFAHVSPLGFNDADMRGSVSGHPGATTRATALAALTKVIT